MGNDYKYKFSDFVSITDLIDQSKYILIGYQAFYKDGSNKFYENIKDIDIGTAANPLSAIKQVGKENKFANTK